MLKDGPLKGNLAANSMKRWYSEYGNHPFNISISGLEGVSKVDES